jgi:sugar O-acyltransferase (sialic acid O-acetyltransferase NeuD family)
LKYFIYGAGGHSKVVFEAMQLSNQMCKGFIDDKIVDTWMNLPVFDCAFLNSKNSINSSFHIAIGNCFIREKISLEFIQVDFFSVYHPKSIISSSADIDVGSFFAAGSIAGPDVKVGKHSIVNHHAVIDHDCDIGNFCHIAPHVSLGGGVKIGKGVLVGAGAIVLPGIHIDDYSVIGAGAIVTENVQLGSIVVGNPARPKSK